MTRHCFDLVAVHASKQSVFQCFCGTEKLERKKQPALYRATPAETWGPDEPCHSDAHMPLLEPVVVR